MNKKVLVIAVALMAVAMLALPMSAVSATKPMQIAGQWEYRGPYQPPANFKKVGANAFVTWYNNGEYTVGPILGDFSQVMDWTFHYGDPKIVRSLPETYGSAWHTTPHDNYRRIVRVFEGTVNGVSGTLTMHLECWATSPSTPGSVKGKWVIISGTGGLSNLNGLGTWTNVASGLLEYEGQIHFDP